MDLKIRVYLVLLVLGIALHHVQAAGKCDWPLGTCTYIYDPCPPDWERCDQYDKDCPLATNHCCCRKNPPIVADEPKKPRAQPAPRLCDWPRGTCTYIHDPCPPDWELCPQYDDCPLSTNHCCCRKRKPSIPPPWTPRPPPPWTPQPPKNLCDWPRGTCTYIHDPCPPNWERCSQYDSGCTSPTNHCCCRRKRLEADEPKKSPRLYQDVAAPCDWPYGTCTYTKDPCPPNWIRCPGRDSGCSLPTNHCCCRTTPTPPPGKCDWPRGTCTYYKDPCPPNWERCTDYDIDCKLKTNHCCCRKETSVREAAKPCDWPIGTCTHKGEACPPGWKRCKKNDGGCKNPENQCCCRP